MSWRITMNEKKKRKEDIINDIIPKIEELQRLGLTTPLCLSLHMLPAKLEWEKDPICKVCGGTMYCPNEKSYDGQLILISRKYCSRKCLEERRIEKYTLEIQDNFSKYKNKMKSQLYRMFKGKINTIKTVLTKLIEDGVIDKCILENGGKLKCIS